MIVRGDLPSERPATNCTNQRLSSFVAAAGRTNFIFRKVKPLQDCEANGRIKFHSTRDNFAKLHLRREKNSVDLKLEPTSEISCTNFMKSYVDKLKKERKRQSKKIKDSRQSRQEADRSSFSNKTDSGKHEIYVAQQRNQIFVLEKMSKPSFSNSIEFTDEDLTSLWKPSHIRRESEEQQKWQQPAWANKQKIQKIIRQIRISRKTIQDIEQPCMKSEYIPKHEITTELPNNLPILVHKSRDNRKIKSRQVSRIPEINFRSLEPWKHQNNICQFSIEEYNQNEEHL